MKKIIFTIFVLFFATYSVAQTTIPVTFRVDMGVQVFRGAFNPATQQVVIRGNFQSDAGDPGGNWQGNMFVLSDPDGDTIYTRVVNFPAATVNNNYEFKFVIAPDGWESTPNRTFRVVSPSVMLPIYWFNNDSSYALPVTNTFNFTADISGILGVGSGGAFDPNVDSLLVMGMTWNGIGTVLNEANRRMRNVNPFNPGIFTTSLQVRGTMGAEEKFKFKAFPDNRFSNNGWETGDDRLISFGDNNATINVPTIVPRITPLMPPIANNVNIRITVDMTGARNRYNNQPVPLNQIQFVGMRGGADFLGSWNAGGCWCVNDTVTGQMKVLRPIGNNRYQITVTAPAGTPGGVYEYKFGVMYPGADTVNGGSNPLDNEAGFGQNHRFTLFNAPNQLIVLDRRFGDWAASVDRISDIIPAKFELLQNYPNPFNPITNIRYNLPRESKVTLKIFNSLGEEIVTLFEEIQAPGSYEVKFSANNLPSGMYFYRLEADGVSKTMKMMLIK